jgi:hypothetical protein
VCPTTLDDDEDHPTPVHTAGEPPQNQRKFDPKPGLPGFQGWLGRFNEAIKPWLGAIAAFLTITTLLSTFVAIALALGFSFTTPKEQAEQTHSEVEALRVEMNAKFDSANARINDLAVADQQSLAQRQYLQNLAEALTRAECFKLAAEKNYTALGALPCSTLIQGWNPASLNRRISRRLDPIILVARPVLPPFSLSVSPVPTLTFTY